LSNVYSVYSRGVRREKCCRNNIYRLLFIFIQVFIGSSNAQEMMYVSLGAAIFGRHFRIVPQSWYRHICMRVELNGCQGGQMLYMSSASNVTSVSAISPKLITFDIGATLSLWYNFCRDVKSECFRRVQVTLGKNSVYLYRNPSYFFVTFCFKHIISLS